MSVGIAGMGFYVPEQRRTNQMVVSDIREALKGTDSDWLNKTAEDIVRVSGIKERRIAAKKAKYTNGEWPDTSLPITGICSINGMSHLGSPSMFLS